VLSRYVLVTLMARAFSHITPIQDAANEHTLTLHCADPGGFCPSSGGFGAYSDGPGIVYVLIPLRNSTN
jgi:hypothetical protein